MFKRSEVGSIIISIILLSLGFIVMLFGFSYAGGGFIDGTMPKNYLTAPAIGSNVIGYLIGNYSEKNATFHIFVRKDECKKRIPNHANEGVFVHITETMSQEEFNNISPLNLKGMIDTDGELSKTLGGQPGVLAVIKNIKEFQKSVNPQTSNTTNIVARINIKFVSEVQ